MKITLLSTLYTPYISGGAERAATLLAEALAASGHEVSVITLHPKPLEEVEELRGVRVYRLPMDNVYWPFQRDYPPGRLMKMLWHLHDIWNGKAAKRVARILDLERPDVVHSHVIAGFSVAVLREVKRRQIRLVHTLHDYYLICFRSSAFRAREPCNGQCLQCKATTLPRKLQARLIDVAIPVSHYLLHRHRDSGCLLDSQAQVIPNISNLFPEKVSATVTTPLPVATICFGFMGRVEPQKGIEVLLKACQALPGDWKLRIAGHASPAYLRSLQKTYPDSRIEWLGFTEARSFFQSIDVSIVPSIWPDPQPYVVIESLEAGKSVFASASGGITEMADLGAKFHLFPPGNVDALRSLMQEAVLNPKEWSPGGFRYPALRNRFLPASIVTAHEAIYRGTSS